MLYLYVINLYQIIILLVSNSESSESTINLRTLRHYKKPLNMCVLHNIKVLLQMIHEMNHGALGEFHFRDQCETTEHTIDCVRATCTMHRFVF